MISRRRDAARFRGRAGRRRGPEAAFEPGAAARRPAPGGGDSPRRAGRAGGAGADRRPALPARPRGSRPAGSRRFAGRARSRRRLRPAPLPGDPARDVPERRAAGPPCCRGALPRALALRCPGRLGERYGAARRRPRRLAEPRPQDAGSGPGRGPRPGLGAIRAADPARRRRRCVLVAQRASRARARPDGRDRAPVAGRCGARAGLAVGLAMQGPDKSEMAAGRGLRGLYGPRGIVTYAEKAGRVLSRPDGPRVAVLEMGGWDTHANQGRTSGRLANHLAAFADGMAELKAVLGAAWAQTAVLAVSEFRPHGGAQRHQRHRSRGRRGGLRVRRRRRRRAGVGRLARSQGIPSSTRDGICGRRPTCAPCSSRFCATTWASTKAPSRPRFSREAAPHRRSTACSSREAFGRGHYLNFAEPSRSLQWLDRAILSETLQFLAHSLGIRGLGEGGYEHPEEDALVAQVDLLHEQRLAGKLRRIVRLQRRPGRLDIALQLRRFQVEGEGGRRRWSVRCRWSIRCRWGFGRRWAAGCRSSGAVAGLRPRLDRRSWPWLRRSVRSADLG